MTICSCGCITNGGRAQCDRCTALAAFGLTRDATETEIKDAYRLLAKVWHPDRFQSDEQLRLKAEEQLKAINSAYQVLTSTVSGAAYSKPAGPASPPEESQQAAAAAPGRAPYQRPSPRHFNPSFGTKRHPNKKRLAIAIAILVAGGIWMYLRYGRMASPVNSAHMDDAPRQTFAKSTVPPAGIDQSSKQLPNQETSDSARPTEKVGGHTRAKAAASALASLVVYPDDDPQVPYFTVGSTKNDVVRIQGTPTSLTGNVFRYGLSEVYFQNGRVQSWRMDPSAPLKARMPQP